MAFCLAAWGAVEITSGAFALPPAVLRFLIIASVLGAAPVAAAAWLFRVGPDTPTGRPGLAGFLVSALALGAIAGAMVLSTPVVGGGPEAAEEPRILVLPFTNLTGDDELEFLGAQAADWITEGLQRSNLAGVVPTTTALAVARWVNDRPDGGAATDPIIASAGEVGATLIVTGTYSSQGDSLRFLGQISGGTSGELRSSLGPVTTSRSTTGSAIQALREQATVAVGLLLDERMAPVAGEQNPPTGEAYRLFQEGMEKYMRLASREALPKFVGAYRADTTFLVAQYFAGLQYANLGQRDSAAAIFADLHRRRSLLSAYYRHLVDAAVAFGESDWEGARRASRSAAELAPHSKAFYDWGFQAILAGRPREALEAFGHLTAGRGAMRGWTSLTYMIADAHHTLGEYEAALSAARESERLFPDRPVTNAMQIGRELAALGEIDAVRDVVADVRSHLGSSETQGLGQRGSIPRTLHFIALELRAHGHGTEASQVFADVIEWINQRSSQGGSSRAHRYDLAFALYETERNEEALVVVNDLLDGDSGNLELIGRRAVLLARLDRTAEADATRGSLAAMSTDVGFNWAASVSVELGDSDRALLELETALEIGGSRWLWQHTNAALNPLRETTRFKQIARLLG